MLIIILISDINSSLSIPDECSPMPTIPEPTAATDSVTPQATEGESTVAESTATITISLASVIAFILLLLVTGGITLAIVRVLRKRRIKEVTQVKYSSGEGGYLEAVDGSRVDGGFENRVVSFNFLSLNVSYDLFNFISVLQP